MKISDHIILIPWILGFINLSAPFSNFYFFWIVTTIFYGLFLAHLIECIVYRDKIINGPKNSFFGFFLTLVYGVLFLKSFSHKN